MSGALLLLAALAQAAPAPGAFERFSVLTPSGAAEPRPELLAGVKRLLYAEHRVRPGEGGIESVAKRFGTSKESLQSTNQREYYFLDAGTRMIVQNRPGGGLYAVRKDGETLDEVVARYWRGGSPAWLRKKKEEIVAANGLPGAALLSPWELEKGQRLLLPGVYARFDGFTIPFATRGRFSSGFGYRRHPVRRTRRFHEGLDIAKPHGTPVYAPRSGRVIQAGWHEGYGQLVVLQHPNGWTSRYGHLSKINVQVGDLVERRRTVIGRVGSTGLSTGPHLHFEIRDAAGKALNPGHYIRQ